MRSEGNAAGGKSPGSWARRALGAAALLAAAAVAAVELWPRGGGLDPRWEAWRAEVHRPSELPGVGYELRPGVERSLGAWSVAASSLGARDGEPLPGGDVFRVAALGGSFTFGYGVAVEQAWPALLERELWRSILVMGRDVDFLDLAVSGHGLTRQVALLEGRALALEPWVVVLEHSFEDPAAPHLAALRDLGAERESGPRSRILSWLAGSGAHGVAPSIEALHDPEGPHWKELSQSLARSRELCAARGIPRVLVIVPRVGPEPWDRYPYRALHAQVAAEGRRQGCEVLDLLERFAAEPPESLVLGSGEPAPGARAHALAADAIKRFLYSSGVLGQVLERH